MPWFEYVCDRCGGHVVRHRPVAHRDIAPRHNEEDGCWDGQLVRVAPVRGPGALRWHDARHRHPRRPPAAPPDQR